MGKCHLGLLDAIISSGMAGLVILGSQGCTQFVISPHCTSGRPKSQFQDLGHCILAHDIMHTLRYGIVPTLRYDSQSFTFKFSTVQCTVQCTLKVVATREESLSAMAEWVMFDAGLSDTCDLSSGNSFSVSALDQILMRRI